MNELPLASIRVNGRQRKDLGALQPLADSIAAVGLLQPLVVRPDNVLVAGQRRLEALRLLGRTTAAVRIVGGLDEAAALLRAERDENTCRKDFLPSEAAALGRLLEEAEREEAKRRQGTRTDLPEHCGKFPQQEEVEVEKRGKSYEKAKAVVAAAESDPKLGGLVTLMDSENNVLK